MDVKLNFPLFEMKLKTENGQTKIFDTIRKKYVVLTPEELVRQHVINFLVSVKGFPTGLLGVEQKVTVNSLPQRADIIAYNKQGEALLVVECKSYTTELTQQVYAQAARYNISLKAPFLMVTNGIKHFCSKIDFDKKVSYPLETVPKFEEISKPNF